MPNKSSKTMTDGVSAQPKQTLKTDAEIEAWMTEHRNLYHSGQLASWQIARLELIPGWSWGEAQAAPIHQRKSDHCMITVDLVQRSERRDTNIGPMTDYYDAWEGHLYEGDEITGDDEPLASESGEGATLQEGDAVIRSLKWQARQMGYKRCSVIDHTLDGYTETRALRAARQSKRPKVSVLPVAA